MATTKIRRKPKSVGKSGVSLTAEESGKIIEALEAADRKETSINLRVSRAKKDEIKELAAVMGVSSAHILLTAFFEYKNRLFGESAVKTKKRKLKK